MKNQNMKFIIMAAVVVVVLAVYLSSRSSGPGQYDLADLPRGQQEAGSEEEPSTMTEAEQEYRQGRVLLDSGDVAGGRMHLERAIELDPASARAHNDLGVAYARQGLFEQAIGEYETALEINPDYLEALYNLGNALQATEQAEKAIESYRSVLRLNNSYYRAHNNLGGLFAQAGELDSAVVHLEAAVEINPDFADAHRNLANIYEYLGDSAKTAEHSRIVESLQQR